MDISGMTEEEQMEAAMKLSLESIAPGGLRNAASGGNDFTQPWMDSPQEQPATLPEPAQPRSFPSKDPQDCLTGPSRSSKKKRGEPQVTPPESHYVLQSSEVNELIRFLFGRAEVADVERWFKVGFTFSPLAGTEWGLLQRHGGPCGVFAPVQGFMLKQLLFSEGSDGSRQDPPPDKLLACPQGAEEDLRGATLAFALASILFRSTGTSSYVVCQVSPSGTAEVADPDEAVTRAAIAIATGDAGSQVTVHSTRVSRISEVQQLLEEAADAWLGGPYGVLSFVCSVLLTRGLETLREDMDDPNTPLIGRFGHCSQELVNLMLIGEATSNVFDGCRELGGDADDPTSKLLVKGVDGGRVGLPTIGFLSEMEPMRYLQVGSLYKHPEFPLWVLGSPTHYTLIFSTQKADAKLSREAQLEQMAKKVFVENSVDEGGLAMSSSLDSMLRSLGVSDKLKEAQSQLVREEVILWDDFRQWLLKQFGCGGTSDSAASSKVRLFLYDGQDPPGPTLRQINLELCDIDPRLAGGEGDSFSATLHTRWPNAVVQVETAAGAG